MKIEILENVIPFSLGLVIGFFSGYITHHLIHKKGIENERGIVASAVTFVWILSTIFDIASNEYQTPTEIHIIMGIITGYFFEGSIREFFQKNIKK